MGLQLYDTVAAAVRPFVPRVAGQAGIYLCGATVQSPPHIGHVRSAVAFDVLRRWLTHTGHDVTMIRNVTDIDDKILVRAAATGRPWWSIAYDNEQAFNAAYDALNVMRPTYEPRATGHIPEMVTLIEELVSYGHAYAAPDGSGDVYFDVASWPAYGELSHQRAADMEPAADADPRGKRDPRDFALWKGHKPGDPTTASWPTPWGAGRPGWHLECSAMARKYLGSAFDIHAGGIDLRFPHHENEQAQSRAAKDGFAAYWMHNGWVTAGGDKMSKSLGNGLGVPEVLQRVRPGELRYYLGSANYRSMIEFSEQAMQDAATAYRRIESFLARAGEQSLGSTPGEPPVGRLAGRPPVGDGPAQVLPGEAPAGQLPAGQVPAAFAAALDDDLGVPQALAVLHDTVREGNRALDRLDPAGVSAAVGGVRAMTRILGIDPADFTGSAESGGAADAGGHALRVLVERLVETRAAARARRDFAGADAARDHLAAAGVHLADGADATTWSLAADASAPPAPTASAPRAPTASAPRAPTASAPRAPTASAPLAPTASAPLAPTAGGSRADAARRVSTTRSGAAGG